jgi:hypothetical protein
MMRALEFGLQVGGWRLEAGGWMVGERILYIMHTSNWHISHLHTMHCVYRGYLCMVDTR